MFSKIAIVAAIASLVAAQKEPVGPVPIGNPVSAPLSVIVPACKPFTITWTPTTAGPISIVLRKGPSENNVRFGPAIAIAIPNSGSFVWTPSADLEATPGVGGYGIQLIDEVTGQYQYSNQFGISKNAADCGAASSAASSTPAGYPMSTPAGYSMSMMSTPVPSSKATPSSKMVSHVSSHPVYSTGMPAGNSSIVQPTKPITMPSSLIQTPTGASTKTSAPAQQTANAASGFQAGLGMVGAAAAFAFML